MPTTAYSRDWLDKQLRRRGTLLARYGTQQSTSPAVEAATVKPIRRMPRIPRGTSASSIRRLSDALHFVTSDPQGAMPEVWSKNSRTPKTVVDTGAATTVLNLEESSVFQYTLTANRTISVINATVGQCFMIRLEQDGGGGRTVTWFTEIKWAGGVAPTLTTTANKADMLGFFCRSEGQFDAFVVGSSI